MLINELAEQVDLPVHTIRFYERQGLLDSTLFTRAENNYRHYAPEAVQRILLIKRGQAAGFTLGQIRALIHAWEEGALSIEEQRAIVLARLEEIERKMGELEQMQAYLLAKLTALNEPGSDATFEIDSRATSRP